MNQHEDGAAGSPGPAAPAETDRLLRGVQDDVQLLNELDSTDQVPVYDRIHTALADALARTADTGVPPDPVRSGA